MAPKYKVSRDDIVQAAYQLLEEYGAAYVTARAIAEKLGVSSRPIYSYFPSMEALFAELIVVSTKVLKEYMHRNYTPDSFLNMGVGNVMFYREKPCVAEYLETRCSAEMIDRMERQMMDEFYVCMDAAQVYRDITKESLSDLYHKMSIFSSGLVMNVRMNRHAYSLEEIIRILRETGEALFVHVIWEKKGKPEF